MHLPQITLIVIWAVGIGLTWADHGKPKTGYESIWPTLLSTALTAFLLYMGGFFGAH